MSRDWQGEDDGGVAFSFQASKIPLAQGFSSKTLGLSLCVWLCERDEGFGLGVVFCEGFKWWGGEKGVYSGLSSNFEWRGGLGLGLGLKNTKLACKNKWGSSRVKYACTKGLTH